MGQPGGLLRAQALPHHPVITKDPHSLGVLSSLPPFSTGSQPLSSPRYSQVPAKLRSWCSR